MKLKKVITGILLMILFMSQFSMIPFNHFVYAEEINDTNTTSQNSTKFHYQQLNDIAKKIYDAIYDMYVQGILKTGTQDYDLVEKGYFTQEEAKAYEKGSSELTSAMNAARYAFYADYPEVFYLNFQCLSIRTTKNKVDGNYHIYVGSGRYPDYYVEGFHNQEEVQAAIDEFEAKVNQIVEAAKNMKVEENKNQVVEQIKFVHNEIIYNTSYRLEDTCTPGNEGFLGTPYGSLVKQQAVCEGYARALKTILDRLDIHCILVQGTHQSDGEAAVPHMWNYVEIEKESNSRAIETIWYAIDATMDDPFIQTITMNKDEDIEPGSNIVEGFENTRYCLVGSDTMQHEHMAIETVEAAGNYTFHYPELYHEDYSTDTIFNEKGLVVKYKEDGTETEDYKAGDYYISYNEKGFIGAAEEGKYIMMKSHSYRPGDQVWEVSKWAYFLPDVYAGGFKDNGNHMYLSMPNAEYVEFAVTTLAPGDYKNDVKYLTYQGDESDFVVQTGKLYNPSGTFKAKPYIKTQTPAPTATLTVGPTYHVDVTYDDDLVLAEGVTEAGYKMTSTGTTGAEESEITNFAFDGKRRITFDLKFSKMYADDGANYRIYITGLVGKNSGKAPMAISYGAINPILCSFRMNKAKNWEVFARPSLLESEDLSMNGWQTSDGTPVSDKLKSRIALVTTRTTTEEKEDMNNLMKNELQGQELIKSETYNISLNVCKKYVVKTGHRLRLSLGFPAGYGPEDEGVTFKAYHFKRDAQGNVAGVEEIPCVVTQYGLIVTCDSFSPFAVAVVESDGTIPQNKALIVAAEDGGVIEGANREEGNIVTLAENESVNLTVKPEEGYEIETITVCGEEIEVTNKELMDLTVAYNDIKDNNNIVSATFIAKSVIEKEEERQETVVTPKPEVANITSMPEQVEVPEYTTLTIVPEIEETEGILTYQWYKGDEKLIGKTSKNLTISSIRKEDAGEYSLKVTTTVDTISAETTSKPCRVIVTKGIVSSEIYIIDSEVISKVVPETTVSQFKENIETDQELVFTDKEGNTLAEDSILGTGMKVKAGEKVEYTIAITGDVNGDGKADFQDILQINKHRLGKGQLESINLIAGDVNSDGKADFQDILQINKYRLGKVDHL